MLSGLVETQVFTNSNRTTHATPIFSTLKFRNVQQNVDTQPFEITSHKQTSHPSNHINQIFVRLKNQKTFVGIYTPLEGTPFKEEFFFYNPKTEHSSHTKGQATFLSKVNLKIVKKMKEVEKVDKFVESCIGGRPKNGISFLWKVGHYFFGKWVKNKRDGVGFFIFKNGDIVKCHWNDGKRNEYVKITWNDNSIYEGEFPATYEGGQGGQTFFEEVQKVKRETILVKKIIQSVKMSEENDEIIKNLKIIEKEKIEIEKKSQDVKKEKAELRENAIERENSMRREMLLIFLRKTQMANEIRGFKKIKGRRRNSN